MVDPFEQAVVINVHILSDMQIWPLRGSPVLFNQIHGEVAQCVRNSTVNLCNPESLVERISSLRKNILVNLMKHLLVNTLKMKK